jgi:hypothetical protein
LSKNKKRLSNQRSGVFCAFFVVMDDRGDRFTVTLEWSVSVDAIDEGEQTPLLNRAKALAYLTKLAFTLAIVR